MKQANEYANKIVDNLKLEKLTIKELKLIIATAWEDGYKAGQYIDGNNNHNIPEYPQVEIKEHWWEKIKPNEPYILRDPTNPYVPIKFPGLHYPNTPWLPIVYC